MATAAISCSVAALPIMPALVVEQVALAVLLEDGAEDPAVAVEVGELGVPRLRVQLGDALEKRAGRTRAPAPRSRRGWTSAPGCIPRRSGGVCSRGYISSPSVSSSHHM